MHHMSNALRSEIITLAGSLGWEVQHRSDGRGDLYDKLLSFTHHSFPSRLCIDKKNGITKAGEVKHFKVVVHPEHYQKDLEDVTEGIRPAINQRTKKNLHSHSGFKGFVYSEENKEPCGTGYQVMGMPSLGVLLSRLVGRDPADMGESGARVIDRLVESLGDDMTTSSTPDIKPSVPEKALVIDDPWLGKILAGEKTWEMRSRQISLRGTIGLIRKGSGQVVGTADLIDVRGPLSQLALSEASHLHGITPNLLAPGEWMDRWNVAWVLDNVRMFDEPIRYIHLSGAVTWVRLDEVVRDRIRKVLL